MCAARVLQLLRALFFFIEARCSLPYSQWRHDTPLCGFRCTHASQSIHPLPRFSPSLELTQGKWEMDSERFFKKNHLAGEPLVCEARRCISFRFLVFHCTDTHGCIPFSSRFICKKNLNPYPPHPTLFLCVCVCVWVYVTSTLTTMCVCTWSLSPSLSLSLSLSLEEGRDTTFPDYNELSRVQHWFVKTRLVVFFNFKWPGFLRCLRGPLLLCIMIW